MVKRRDLARDRLKNNVGLTMHEASMEVDNIGAAHGKIKRIQHKIFDMRKEHQKITKPPFQSEDAAEQKLLRSCFSMADELRQAMEMNVLRMTDLKEELSKLSMKMKGRR